MKIAELFAEVSFKWDSMKLKEFAKGVGDLNLSSIISTGSLVKLGETIKDLLIDSVQTSSALTTLSKATGIPTDYIQRFEKLSKALGSSKEEADSFLNTLGKVQLAISQGRGDATPFVLLGINPMGKSKEQLASLIAGRFQDENFLKGLANRFGMKGQGVDEIRAELKRQIGGGLGISDSMLKVLSSKQFEKQLNPATSEFEVQSQQEIQDANEAMFEYTKATENLTQSFKTLANVLLPMVTTGAEDVSGILKFVKWSFTDDDWKTKSGVKWIDNMKPINWSGMFAGAFGGQGDGIKKMYEQKNNVYVTVHASSPEEFVRRFDPIWKKYIANADLQFGQGT